MAFGAALLLAGCPKRPFTFGARGEVRDPGVLLAALAGRSAKLHRLQGEGRVALDGQAGKGSTGMLVAAERPDHLRFEVDDFFGNPAAVLTSDGRLLHLFQANGNTFASGPATPHNLAALVPGDFELPELIDLLFGDPRPISEVRGLVVDRDRYAYALLFETPDGARRQRIDLDVESLLPVGAQVIGEQAYRASFGQPEQQSGLQLPERVEIESQAGKAKLELRQLEANPNLAPDVFVAIAPPGAHALEFP